MALVGDLIKHQYIESDTEKETKTIEFPLDIESDHIFYDKRGTTETYEIPKVDHIQEHFKSVYVTVHSVNYWKQDDTNFMNICYRVYASKEDRKSDLNSFLFEDDIMAVKVDFSIVSAAAFTISSFGKSNFSSFLPFKKFNFARKLTLTLFMH